MPTHGSMTSNRLDIARIEALIDDRFPQIHSGGRIFNIEEIGERNARVRMRHHERMLRPGGTVSGPAMFTLADFSVYVAIIATLGEAGIDAVTTNLNINFLAKPEARDMVAAVQPHPPRPPAGRGRGAALLRRGRATWWRTRSPPTRCRRSR